MKNTDFTGYNSIPEMQESVTKDISFRKLV